MKQFSSQIRLQKWALDEVQRRLADLIRLEERLTGDRTRLEAELEAEQNIAGSSFDNSLTYGAYAIQLLQRRDKIDESIAAVVEQAAQAREILKDSFTELKKFELASEAIQQRAQRQLSQREQQQQDEMALTIFRRREG